MDYLTGHTLRQLPGTTLDMAHQALTGLTDLCKTKNHGGLTVGTACSGSGCAELWLEKLQDFLKGVRFDCRFAVEADASKRMWLEAVIPHVPVLFGDTTKLHKTRSINLKLKEETPLVPIEDVVFFTCGFCCRSISMLNSSAKSNTQCIAQKTGLTGETAAGTIGYLKTHHPAFVILENVPTLNGSNYDELKRQILELGYRIGVVEVFRLVVCALCCYALFSLLCFVVSSPMAVVLPRAPPPHAAGIALVFCP